MSDPPVPEHEVVLPATRDAAQALLRRVTADISASIDAATEDLGKVVEMGLREAADAIAKQRDQDVEPPTAA